MTKLYSATVYVLVCADNEDEACDAIAENLRGEFYDWGYKRTEYGYEHPKCVGVAPAEYDEEMRGS